MENILAIKTQNLSEILQNHTYTLIRCNKEDILSLLCNYEYVQRESVENDKTYRQIIPYCLLSFGEQYILFKRLSKQTEKRLHSRLTLGAGGHINELDRDESLERTILNCIVREIDEEISIDYNKEENFRFLGLINDETCDVSRHHLGILVGIQLNKAMVSVNETEKMSAEWRTIEQLKHDRTNFEDWSKIVFDQYIISKQSDVG